MQMISGLPVQSAYTIWCNVYTTNPDFRKAVNNGEIAYNDIHLSQMAQEVRYGFMGKVDVAILEAHIIRM